MNQVLVILSLLAHSTSALLAAGVDAEVQVSHLRYCLGDAEIKLLELTADLSLTNNGTVGVLVPRGLLVAEVRVAKSRAKLENGQFDHRTSLSWVTAEALVAPGTENQNHFWLLKPEGVIKVPIKVRIPVRTSPTAPSDLGPGGGRLFVKVVIGSTPVRALSALPSEARTGGPPEVVSLPLQSRVFEIEVSDTPVFVACP